MGFNTALTRAINDYGRKYKIMKDNEQNLKGEDVRESLTAVVSIKMADPQFESQTKIQAGQRRGAAYWWTVWSARSFPPIWRRIRRWHALLLEQAA